MPQSVIYLSSEYEGNCQPLQSINITMFSAMLEIQSYIRKEATMFTLARPTVGLVSHSQILVIADTRVWLREITLKTLFVGERWY